MKHSPDEFSTAMLPCTLSKYSLVNAALHIHTFLEMLHRQQGMMSGNSPVSMFAVLYHNRPDTRVCSPASYKVLSQ